MSGFCLLLKLLVISLQIWLPTTSPSVFLKFDIVFSVIPKPITQFFLGLIFLILFYIIGIFYGENSIGRLDKMVQEKIILENKIVKLKEDNKIARMELDSFTNDPEALEGYARSKLNLIKKGEVLIELVPNE